MRQIRTCSFLALVVASIPVATAHATLLSLSQDGSLSIADFAESELVYAQCIAAGGSEQQCFKVKWDPQYITEGVMTVDITPLNGDTSRVGDVIQVTFFNGYTGAGPFTRTDLADKVRYEIPVISVEKPPMTNGIDIVELQVADIGGTQSFFDFNISARDLVVLRDDGTLDTNPMIVPKTELLGFDIDLTPDQQVPAPIISEGSDPFGQASVNISDPDPNDGEASISIHGVFSGMTSSPVSASLKGPAAIGEIGDTILDLEFFEGTFGINDASISDAALGDLMSGLTYLEIATEMNDAGEIRGQIIPEPSSVSLLLLGLIPLTLRRRR